ncbi:hypothetical protein A2442_03150 [Candidatus Campbellbacteria bacterium RIFOXYC2_FULL_35_25]|uniref:Uncharacterized protein n=1 Tax=Candidatus Campbellbacteria bacterium RIFOXYC2_FULL_35_25 TaxID=1797582 RepID=A0A1F5EJS5_9BACT|nr:MAG: hypothetical protein A2442_03150 [Candidatus Campbellbacteria bacterium RIFOXYC2_FULL_35_25]
MEDNKNKSAQNQQNPAVQGAVPNLVQNSDISANYKWYSDRATLIALITGFFSFAISLVSVFTR